MIYCVKRRSGFQPEGLADSSRWSQRSADHRTTIDMIPDPEGVSEIFEPLRVAGVFCLPALQAEIDWVSFHTASVAGTHPLPRGGTDFLTSQRPLGTTLRTSVCEADIVNNHRPIDQGALVTVNANLHRG